jgi:hypothetical protein
MRKWIVITFVLLSLVIVFVLFTLNQQHAAPLKLTFMGYTNAPVGLRAGFFGATQPIDVPVGSRVGLFGITNVGSTMVSRWSTCIVEVRGLGTTNAWLASVASLEPGQGECFLVPLPSITGGWRVVLRSTQGWKNWWNDTVVHSRFVPSAKPDQTFGDWVDR